MNGSRDPKRTPSGELAAQSGDYRSGQFRRSPSANRLEAAPEFSWLEMNAPGTTTLVRISCSPGSELLEATHQFFTAYLASRSRPQVAHRFGVAVYELFANALAYGSLTGEVELALLSAGDVLGVSVSNDAIPARFSMLNEHLSKIRNNAEATIVEEMRRSVAGGPRPMLGLARVVHEAGLRLQLRADGRRLTMLASAVA